MPKVLVALSGGLDSAATTLILKLHNHSVHTIYINMHGNDNHVQQARLVAQKLNVPIDIIDAQQQFKNDVINYFITELTNGRTPAPCSFCNPNLKWKILYEYAMQNDFEYIATGHYVKTVNISGNIFITKGVDVVKDQSYYLWDLPQEYLQKALFPLGDLTKMQTRKLLSDNGFQDISETKESMSLCFLPLSVSYSDFVRSQIDVKEGDVVDLQGRVVGRHNGTPLYTIGQRRGFELFEESGKFAVLKVDAGGNRLIVSDNERDFYTKTLVVERWSAASVELLLQSDDLSVVVRGLGRNPSGYCKVEQCGERLKVELEGEAWAVAAGQPVVFYKGDMLVGGGYLADDGDL